jgi:hypothetical protein
MANLRFAPVARLAVGLVLSSALAIASSSARAASDPNESWYSRSVPGSQRSDADIAREIDEVLRRMAENGSRAAGISNAVQQQALSAARPASGGASAMEDVLRILKREGMIDDGEAQKVMVKYAAEQKQAVPKWAQGLDFTGDFNLRYESFFFDKDSRGIESPTRTRFQYRARLGVTKQLSERVKLGLRLASGAGNSRSAQQSFGETENDQFAPDGIFFDRVFLEFKLQETTSSQTQIVVGKLANPFLSRTGPDFLAFDSDLNMEGAFITSSYRPTEFSRVYATLGGFIVDEIADGSDPKLYGGQVGLDTALSPAIRVGLRFSGYQFRSLNPMFIATGMGFGNLASAFDDAARIGETYLYASYAWSETWPIFLFGTALRNFSADAERINGFEVDDEDTAYGFGVTIGNPTKLVALSIAYYRSEANAFPAQFPDGATFDTLGNREGILAAAARKLNPLTDLRLVYSDIEEIRDLGGMMGPFAATIGNADRKRIVADLVFTF